MAKDQSPLQDLEVAPHSRPYLLVQLTREEYIETTVEGKEKGGRKRDEGKTGAVKCGGQGGTTDQVLSRLNRK